MAHSACVATIIFDDRSKRETVLRFRLEAPYHPILRYRPISFPRVLSSEERSRFVAGFLLQVEADLQERGFEGVVLRGEQKEPPPPAPASDYPLVPDWSRQEMLEREKDALGVYLSGHPNDRYEDLPHALRGLTTVSELPQQEPLSRVQVVGTVENYDEKIYRDGDRRALFFLDDGNGRVLVRVPKRKIELLSALLSTVRVPVVVTAQVTFPKPVESVDGVDFAAPEPTLGLEHVVLLHEQIADETRFIALRIPEKLASPKRFMDLQEACKAHPGHTRVRLVLALADQKEAALDLPRSLSVHPSETFLKVIEDLFLAPQTESDAPRKTA